MAGISVLFKPTLYGEQLLQLLQVTGIVLKTTAVIESLRGLCCCRVFRFLTQAQAQNILLRTVLLNICSGFSQCMWYCFPLFIAINSNSSTTALRPRGHVWANTDSFHYPSLAFYFSFSYIWFKLNIYFKRMYTLKMWHCISNCCVRKYNLHSWCVNLLVPCAAQASLLVVPLLQSYWGRSCILFHSFVQQLRQKGSGSLLCLL